MSVPRALKISLILPFPLALMVVAWVGLLAASPRAAAQPPQEVEVLILRGADMDSWILESLPDNNYGAHDQLNVGRLSPPAAPANVRSLLRFDLSPLPYNAQIISATLELYQVAADGPATYLIIPMAIFGPWEEETVTWNNQPNAFALQDPAVPLDALDGWKQWDVANIVENWAIGEIENYGIMLSGDNDTIGSRTFVSTENPTYPDLVPRLTIAYIPPPPITVNSPLDAGDASPGDGVCDVSVEGGQCTLRAAIQEANALKGANTIVLPSGTYTLTIQGEGEDGAITGDLDILDYLIIEGGGRDNTFINGNGLDTVFHVLPGASAFIHDVTLFNGKGFATAAGGFRNDGFARLANCAVRDSKSDSRGGGIVNYGILEVDRCHIAGNRAEEFGGGIFSGFGGEATIERSQIISNTSQVFGGGIYNEGGAILTMDRSTIAFNRAGADGGGIRNGGLATIANSTISGNRAADGPGGGVFHVGEEALNLNNVTIAYNTASSWGGGIATGPGGALRLQNTLVGRNQSSSNPDCGGELTSGGYNLIQDPTGCVLQGDTNGNITGVAPSITALGNYGGPTLTHALLPGSPAMDAGRPVPEYTAELRCTAYDQRSIVRPQGERCDIGAFEVEVGYPELTINYPRGKPGSYFTLRGSGFPLEEMAEVYINGLKIGSIPTDGEGQFLFLIRTPSTAPPGNYFVLAEVNPLGKVFFGLDNDAPLHRKEDEGTVLDMPADVQPAQTTYMPMLVR